MLQRGLGNVGCCLLGLNPSSFLVKEGSWSCLCFFVTSSVTQWKYYKYLTFFRSKDQQFCCFLCCARHSNTEHITERFVGFVLVMENGQGICQKCAAASSPEQQFYDVVDASKATPQFSSRHSKAQPLALQSVESGKHFVHSSDIGNNTGSLHCATHRIFWFSIFECFSSPFLNILKLHFQGNGVLVQHGIALSCWTTQKQIVTF